MPLYISIYTYLHTVYKYMHILVHAYMNTNIYVKYTLVCCSVSSFLPKETFSLEAGRCKPRLFIHSWQLRPK